MPVLAAAFTFAAFFAVVLTLAVVFLTADFLVVVALVVWDFVVVVLFVLLAAVLTVAAGWLEDLVVAVLVEVVKVDEDE